MLGGHQSVVISVRRDQRAQDEGEQNGNWFHGRHFQFPGNPVSGKALAAGSESLVNPRRAPCGSHQPNDQRDWLRAGISLLVEPDPAGAAQAAGERGRLRVGRDLHDDLVESRRKAMKRRDWLRRINAVDEKDLAVSFRFPRCAGARVPRTMTRHAADRVIQRLALLTIKPLGCLSRKDGLRLRDQKVRFSRIPHALGERVATQRSLRGHFASKRVLEVDHSRYDFPGQLFHHCWKSFSCASAKCFWLGESRSDSLKCNS